MSFLYLTLSLIIYSLSFFLYSIYHRHMIQIFYMNRNPGTLKYTPLNNKKIHQNSFHNFLFIRLLFLLLKIILYLSMLYICKFQDQSAINQIFTINHIIFYRQIIQKILLKTPLYIKERSIWKFLSLPFQQVLSWVLNSINRSLRTCEFFI